MEFRRVLFRSRLEHFIGPPLLQAFMQFYDFDEAKAWDAMNFYRERFKVTGLYENRVFDGVIPLLETLGEQGRQLFIATSNPWRSDARSEGKECVSTCRSRG